VWVGSYIRGTLNGWYINNSEVEQVVSVRLEGYWLSSLRNYEEWRNSKNRGNYDCVKEFLFDKSADTIWVGSLGYLKSLD
jgi:hypothetical protein